MKRVFKVGDVVVLKSDTSPEMVVISVSEGHVLHPIKAAWFCGSYGILHTAFFPEEALYIKKRSITQ